MMSGGRARRFESMCVNGAGVCGVWEKTLAWWMETVDGEWAGE